MLSLILLGTGYMLAVECLVALGQVKLRAAITGVTAVSLNLTIPVFFILLGFDGVLYAMVASQFIPVILLFYIMWKNNVLNPVREIIFLPMFGLGLLAGMLLSNYLSSIL